MITKSGCHAKTIAVKLYVNFKIRLIGPGAGEVFQDLALTADQRIPRLLIGATL